MELMAEVAAAGWPGLKVVELRKVRLMRGVVIDAGVKEVRVVARPRAEPEMDRSPSGLMLDVAIVSPADPRQVYYQAEIELDHRTRGDRTVDTPKSIGEPGLLEGAGPLPMSVEDAYRDLLFHGPLFQGIVSIEAIGPKGATAILRSSSPRDCLRGDPPGDWLIDPVLVDSALQMQVLWARLHWEVTLLPARIQGYRAFGPLSDGSGQALPVDLPIAPAGGRNRAREIRYALRVCSESQIPTCHADHLFLSLDDRPLGVLTGVEGTGSKALNRLAGRCRR
jgi:Polyketide synthase dehydratase